MILEWLTQWDSIARSSKIKYTISDYNYQFIAQAGIKFIVKNIRMQRQ